MSPFRCTTCGTPSDQATSCGACGARTFVLSRELLIRTIPGYQPPAWGQLVSITDAPSLRRERQMRDRGA